MTVYVDDMRAPFRGMVMCHMVADTTAELLAMADRIGVSRRWIQHPGTDREHFDISVSKRRLAVACGATEVSRYDLACVRWPVCGVRVEGAAARNGPRRKPGGQSIEEEQGLSGYGSRSGDSGPGPWNRAEARRG